MEMIILAAGRGSRLMPFTRDVPKCLVEVAPGRSLLDMQLAEIERVDGVDSVTVVAGYRAELVEANLSSRRAGLPVRVVINPDYERTNALYSLWLALERRPAGFLVLNGDTFVRGSIVRRLVTLPDAHDAALAFSSASTLPVDAVKVAATGTTLRGIGKDLDEREATGESVGLARFVGAGASEAIATASELVLGRDGERAYWYTLIRALIASRRIHLVDCPVEEWFEVDQPADLERARRGVAAAVPSRLRITSSGAAD